MRHVYCKFFSLAITDIGVLAQNRHGVFFQYDQAYLSHFENLSPFAIHFDASFQQAPKAPHGGLHGVFADALPDDWGLLLQDRVFRQHDLLPASITAMDRLVDSICIVRAAYLMLIFVHRVWITRILLKPPGCCVNHPPQANCNSKGLFLTY